MNPSYRYPAASLTGDYIRALTGIALTLGPFLLVDTGFWPSFILLALTALFGYFLWRTWLRGRVRYEMDAHAIRCRAEGLASIAGGDIRWADLAALRLRYFSTKRDRSDGWMQLTLTGGGGRMRLDSTLDGVEEVLARAHAAALANNLTLDDATEANLAAYDIGVTPQAGWGGLAAWTGADNADDRRHRS